MMDLIKENPRTIFVGLIGAFLVVFGATQQRDDYVQIGIAIVVSGTFAGATIPKK